MNQLNPLQSTEPLSWAEKNGFAHWAIAMIWLVVALLLFQVVAGVISFVLIILTEGMHSADEMLELLTSRVDLLFIANTIGQILFIGLGSFVVVTLNRTGENKRSFMRIVWNEDTLKYIFLGAILIVVVQPIVIYLGYLNSIIPLPDSMELMQESQYQMILDYLMKDGVLLFALFTVAVVPAICEEILFRGYILRAFEKSWGIIAAIIASGFLFGLFHLQIGNLLPLAMLGFVLAVMTWLSGSIWPAVVAHFINNGAAVVVGINLPELFFQDITKENLPPIWLFLISVLFTCVIIYVMLKSKISERTLLKDD